jgi:hypothetical protein
MRNSASISSTSSLALSRRKVSSIITRIPRPTAERTVAAETAKWPWRVSAWFSALGEIRRGVDERAVEIEDDVGSF